MEQKKVVGRKQTRESRMDLVATTVHELKTPLTVISGLSAMLEAGQFGKLNSQQTKYINRIQTVSDRLLLLIESMLIVAKAQLTPLPPLEPVAVQNVIKEVVAELASRIEQAKISVELPASRSVEPVLAERYYLHQIIYNLLDNPIKYSPPKTTVTIKFRHQEGKLYLRISDQGSGIQPNELKYLYRRFGKVGQPIAAQANSSGLGLYIVKRLVEAQGGSIRAKSLTQGTCFIISLPLAQQLNLFKKPKG